MAPFHSNDCPIERGDPRSRKARGEISESQKQAVSFTLSCSARRHVRACLAGATPVAVWVRFTYVCVCVEVDSYEASFLYVYVHRRVGTSTRVCTSRRACTCACAPPAYVGSHTRVAARASVRVKTQTKGGKPVSSGAPQRREQPFYSNPSGKRRGRRGQVTRSRRVLVRFLFFFFITSFLGDPRRGSRFSRQRGKLVRECPGPG